MAERVLTKTVPTYQVLVSRLDAAGMAGPLPTPGDYSAWQAVTWLRPLSPTVVEAMAPQIARAHLELDLDELGIDPWDWKTLDDLIRLDDRVAIVQTPDAGHTTAVLFVGFVVEFEPRWDAAGRSEVRITALSNAIRLARDSASLVVGRHMRTLADAWASFSGLRAAFNAGGRPNRTSGAYAVDGGPAGGVGAFTGDDADGAVHWTMPEIVEHLQAHYNGAQDWIDNLAFDAAAHAANAAPVSVDVDGRSLWQALADVAERAGWDLWERFYWRDLGAGQYEPRSAIAGLLRRTGSAATISHQGRNLDGSMPPIDLAQTNLLSATIAEGTVNCITRPVVLGAVELVEVTVELGRAWDPASLVVPEGGFICAPGAERRQAWNPYVRAYCANGADFALFADVGRLWDANTDGRYSGAPYHLAVPDMASLAQDAAGSPAANSWPAMAYRPRPRISRDAIQGSGPYLEIAWDGSTWTRYEGPYEVLPDRLAVRLTSANLAEVHNRGADPEAVAVARPWTTANNLFACLIDSGAAGPVRLRLTATIAAPTRAAARPDATAQAGTWFGTGEVIDRGAVGSVRRLAAASRFAAVGGDVADETADIEAIATRVQEALQGRPVEAQLPIEWPDEPIALGQTVAQIAGVGLTLGSDPTRPPRVVGRSLSLTPETMSLTLVLDTDRKAPLR